jgi:transcriptional regulator with XRE-family HTH domain
LKGAIALNLSKLRDVRKSRGLTQRELAARIHTDQPRIAKIENGLSVPKRMAERIAAVLLCGVSDLQTPSEPTVTLKRSELPPELLQRLTK